MTGITIRDRIRIECRMTEVKEVKTFDDLRRLRLADDGYFVITNSTRDAIIHKVNAKCIKADSFNLKVTINDRREGSYYWVDSIATAAHEFMAKRCKVCRPELNLVHPSTFDS
jgi:hypothetical protein